MHHRILCALFESLQGLHDDVESRDQSMPGLCVQTRQQLTGSLQILIASAERPRLSFLLSTRPCRVDSGSMRESDGASDDGFGGRTLQRSLLDIPRLDHCFEATVPVAKLPFWLLGAVRLSGSVGILLFPSSAYPTTKHCQPALLSTTLGIMVCIGIQCSPTLQQLENVLSLHVFRPS